jgi:signal transduction histidine kinase
MLHEFLVVNRRKVLALAERNSAGASENRPTSAASKRGLTKFYEYLIRELKRESKGHPKRSVRSRGKSATALLHGKELSRLGYTVSQVVLEYGALCQAITEAAVDARAPIGTREFSVLNLSLDVAIADAVTGFSSHASVAGVDSTKRMGFLVHELRNALAAAIMAHSMVNKGVVGIGGSTGALLGRNLNRMRDILDHSFSEVRMQNDKVVHSQPVRLIEIVEEVEVTASEEARLRGQTLKVEVDPRLQVEGDRHYLISALSNLVQNAIKYSKRGGLIRVRSRETSASVVLDVEDRCGGLPKGKAEKLFRPFTQKSGDRTGLGLGLTISRQAVALNGGVLSARDLPGKGCVFSISLPKRRDGRNSDVK